MYNEDDGDDADGDPETDDVELDRPRLTPEGDDEAEVPGNHRDKRAEDDQPQR